METLWLPATETWIDGAGHLGFQMSWGGIYGGILQRALVLRLTFTIQSGRSGGNPAEWGQRLQKSARATAAPFQRGMEKKQSLCRTGILGVGWGGGDK